MILLWDFHDTSCKFIRKVSFLYITIYQVNTTLFSLRMRLWDFFPKKTITHENGITVVLAIVLEWNTNKEDGDCKSPGESGRTFFDSGLQIRWNAWREIYWLRISQSAWRKNEIQIKKMGIANPRGEVVEHFLTADCKSAGTPDGRLSDWESARAPGGRMKYK